MGTDKALLRMQPGGPTLIERVIAALRAVTTEILLVTNRPDEHTWLGFPVVGDNYRVGASLAGVEAGLTASPHEYNLIVACDMPSISPELLRGLVNRPRDYDALVPVNRDNQPETLCAIYSRRCLPVIRQRLEQGNYKIAGWLPEVKTSFVPASELEQYDKALQSFVNLNTPEELQRFKDV